MTVKYELLQFRQGSRDDTTKVDPTMQANLMLLARIALAPLTRQFEAIILRPDLSISKMV